MMDKNRNVWLVEGQGKIRLFSYRVISYMLTKDIYRLIILFLSGERKKECRLRVLDWLTITILPTLMQQTRIDRAKWPGNHTQTYVIRRKYHWERWTPSIGETLVSSAIHWNLFDCNNKLISHASRFKAYTQHPRVIDCPLFLFINYAFREIYRSLMNHKFC